MESTAPIRDFVMYAAVFGMFGFAWFGWAQENPPKYWPLFLGIGSLVSAVVAGIGTFLAVRNWNESSALLADGAYQMFGVIVGIEIASMVIGSLMLSKLGASSYVSLWIGIVVALHFIPLAVLFKDNWLFLLTILLAVSQVAAAHIATAKGVTVSAAVGLVTGVILLVFALRGLLLYALTR